MSQSRKAQLAEMVREFVFNLIDGEPEFSGGDAGAIAARTQRAFEREYQNMIDNNEPDYGECADCTGQLEKNSEGNLYCADCDREFTHEDIPDDFPVRPIDPNIKPAPKGLTTCGHCNLSWDDDIPTEYTPAPSARCPFEYFHIYPE